MFMNSDIKSSVMWAMKPSSLYNDHDHNQIRIWPVFSGTILANAFSTLYIHVHPYKNGERKLKISFFFKFKRDNSVKNHRTTTKFGLDLYYLVFELNVRNCCRDNERKRKISSFFLSSRGIAQSKIIGPRPNLNLTCVFLRPIHIWNLSWMCSTVAEILNGNQMMTEQGNTICPRPYYRGGTKRISSRDEC